MSNDDQEYLPGSIPNDGTKSNVVVKVGMIGDSQIGKTALMVKYVEGKFNEDYIETLGKSICISGFKVSLQRRFFPCVFKYLIDMLTFSPLLNTVN